MHTEVTELVALGAFAGAQVLVVCLSAVIASAFRERFLLLHAAAVALGVVALQLQVGGYVFAAQAALLLVLALAGLQLREVMGHAAALRQLRRWMVGISAGFLPLLALLTVLAQVPLLLAGLAGWSAVVTMLMLRAWPRSRPWGAWLAAGLAALGAASAWAGWRALASGGGGGGALVLAALLTLWAATVYLGSVWRSRLFSETRIRLDASKTVDPLTGLSTFLVLSERIQAARGLMKRYGHPSALLLVHIENLKALDAEFGPEAAESAVLEAASRIRQALGDGDVAARLSHSRVAVLAEGASLAEASANLASRILVGGLKQPLPVAPTEFLQFRIVLAAVPFDGLSPRALLQRLGARLEAELSPPSERRILTLTADDLKT